MCWSEWAVEQTIEITTTPVDLEFLPSETDVDRGVRNLEFVLQKVHTRVMKRMTLSPTRGRTRWRHGEDCRNDVIRRQEEGIETFLLRTIISPERCSLLELQAVSERWESYVSRYEKKLKDKLDDEIKLGLEALLPEELEKHLIPNSNRLRTFEDARLENVTYVEAKFGFLNS